MSSFAAAGRRWQAPQRFQISHDSFKAQAVIITGASSGIGRALALQLADEGAWLALAARDAQRLMAVADDCRQRGGQAVAIPTDVAVEAQCRALVEQTHATYGRIDMLVNNAGMAVVGKLEELPDLQLFRRVLDVNFYGMVSCTYAALPALKEVRGRIVVPRVDNRCAWVVRHGTVRAAFPSSHHSWTSSHGFCPVNSP